MRLVVGDQSIHIEPGSSVVARVELDGDESLDELLFVFSGGCLSVVNGLGVQTTDATPCLSIGVEQPHTSPVLVNGRPFPQEGS